MKKESYTTHYYGRNKAEAVKYATSDRLVIFNDTTKANHVKIIYKGLMSRNNKVGWTDRLVNKYKFQFIKVGERKPTEPDIKWRRLNPKMTYSQNKSD